MTQLGIHTVVASYVGDADPALYVDAPVGQWGVGGGVDPAVEARLAALNAEMVKVRRA